MTQDFPPPEMLRKLLRYEPDTGKLFWRRRDPDMFSSGKQSAEKNCAIWNGRFAEKAALSCPDNKGYLHGHICGRKFRAHNVIWAMYFGKWPEFFVDHKNVNPADNRIENLRLATGSQNQMNQGLKSNNTSGYKGVCWAKRERKWLASIKANGLSKNLGFFKTPEDAHAAYVKAAKEIHGDFARFK